MWSRRVPSRFEPNPWSRLVDEKRRRGLPLMDLTVSNPTRVDLPGLEAGALSDALAASRDYDPDPHGLMIARQAVADYYRARGTPVDPAHIVITSSTSEAYAYLIKLLADAGDTFLSPVPSYPLFDPLAALESVTLRPYPLRYDGRWWLDHDAFEQEARSGARGVILVEPNNPTGSVFNAAERAALLETCARHRLPLIADQVFGDFMASGAPHPAWLTGETDVLSFTLSGLSKVAGLPQVKLGWIVVSGPDADVSRAIEGLAWIADTFLSVATPVQQALPELLAGRERFQEAARSRIRANEAFLARIHRAEPSIEILPREGGWSFVARLPRTQTGEEWSLRLLERGVILHPGDFYDLPGEAWLVGSLIVPPEMLEEGMSRLVDLVRE